MLKFIIFGGVGTNERCCPVPCPAGEEIFFEIQDAEIFRIPDPKTRLDALQHYFFPRAQSSGYASLGAGPEVYGIDPFEETTLCHRPAHRKDAREVKDFEEVFVGVCGKREEKWLGSFSSRRYSVQVSSMRAIGCG